MRFAVQLVIGATFLSGSATAQPAWGEPTTSRLPGEVGERDRPEADGVYGRFDGDLDVGLALGLEADDDANRGVARVSAHYFSMIGVYTTYSDALGEDARLERFFAAGVDLRPAFVPRWSRDMQHGPGVLDLALDSISLGLGVWWAKPEARDFGDARGFETSLGMGLPLLGAASGLWLEARGMLRWADPAWAPGADPETVGVVMLSWHEIFLSRARTDEP
jgi:hypothetical protein